MTERLRRHEVITLVTANGGERDRMESVSAFDYGRQVWVSADHVHEVCGAESGVWRWLWCGADRATCEAGVADAPGDVPGACRRAWSMARGDERLIKGEL